MKCSRGCGRATENPSGVCTICEKFLVLDEELRNTAAGAVAKRERSVLSMEAPNPTPPVLPLSGAASSPSPLIRGDRGGFSETAQEINAGMVLNDRPEEENIMTVTGTKTCIDCKNEYKPASNVQKRCPNCKAKFKLSKNGGGQNVEAA
jgi:ssDNA-binding Zn-finger/Zn-ribbon topoisomerase 1